MQAVNKVNIISTIGVAFLFNACCPFVKETKLGNNFILSEYDNADRVILYSEEKCSGSGIPIVPMTVLEYADDSKWVIAKSDSRQKPNPKFWIIDKDFKVSLDEGESAIEKIKAHVYGPLDSSTFIEKMQMEKIDLLLKRI